MVLLGRLPALIRGDTVFDALRRMTFGIRAIRETEGAVSVSHAT